MKNRKRKTSVEIGVELDKMEIGVNCTPSEYQDKVMEKISAEMHEEIDRSIINEIIELAQKIEDTKKPYAKVKDE